MEKTRRLVWVVSIALVVLGLISLALNFIPGWTLNFSWPVVVIVLAAGLALLATTLAVKWAWAAWLHVPAGVLLALGLVFLLNVLTGDWNAWAYAWMLVVAGLGLGLVLSNHERFWRPEVTWVGTGLIISGVTLAVLFGAIVGGRFMQIMAPVLLVVGGLTLRWLLLRTTLAEQLLRRIQPAPPRPPAGANSTSAAVMAAAPPAPSAGLVEPLSARELEVLRLIEQGLSNAEIADRLTLAPSTVKTHINNIYGKLGAQNRVQAIRQAKEQGLLGG